MLFVVFYYLVEDSPTLRQLQDMMRHDNTGFVVRWYELGLELLDSSTSIRKLKEIKADCQNVSECCIKMFEEWLVQQPNTSWDQLISALANLNMNSTAQQIKDDIINGMYGIFLSINFSLISTSYI